VGAEFLLKELVKFSFFYSLSFRSPYQLPNSYDYEHKIGYGSKNFSSEYLWERENGCQFYGREHKGVFDVKNISWKDIKSGKVVLGYRDFVRTAREINMQEVYSAYEVDWRDIGVGVGYSYLWENNLKHPVSCIRINVEGEKWLKFSFALTTNFWDRSLWDVYMGKSVKIHLPSGFEDILGIEFENYVKYNLKGEQRIPENEYWQIKSELRFKFDLTKL